MKRFVIYMTLMYSIGIYLMNIHAIHGGAGPGCDKDSIVYCCDWGWNEHDCCPGPGYSDCGGLVSNHFNLDYTDASDPDWWAENVPAAGGGQQYSTSMANLSVSSSHIAIIQYNPNYIGGGWYFWECGGPSINDCDHSSRAFEFYVGGALYYLDSD